MGEQAPLAVRDPSFGGADAAAAAQHDALRLDHPGLGGDRPQQRNLELERGLADALLERRLDRQSHAAVEQRGRETAVHRAGRIEMDAARLGGDDDAPALRLGHIVTQGLRDRIEGQRPVDEPLDKFQAAHLLLPVGADGPICLAGDVHGIGTIVVIGDASACLAVFGHHHFRSEMPAEPSHVATRSVLASTRNPTGSGGTAT